MALTRMMTLLSTERENPRGAKDDTEQLMWLHFHSQLHLLGKHIH